MRVYPYKKLASVISITGIMLQSCSLGEVRLPPISKIYQNQATKSTEEYPSLFQKAFLEAENRLAAQLNAEIEVPFPKDAGGGYTHEQHKRNYQTIYDAGNLYRLTGDTKYADHAAKILLEYAKMYPTLGEHPEKKEQSPGRLFWQSLNESVFLVYSIQGYEAIRNSLSEEDRTLIENGLFLKLAHFLSEESPATFNKVHNHGTWATAGVGMTGYVLEKEELVEKALLGLDKSGDAGFLKQLDELFSPDGYYSEGPYYQRYALLPFVVFAETAQRYSPEKEIFEYRDGIILKAINTTIHLSYNGLFFPINDALKEKGLTTPELEFGLAAAYNLTGNPEYLSISEYQNTVALNEGGLKVAKAIAQRETRPFPFKTFQLSDGRDGDQGALAIMRSAPSSKHQAVIVKNTSQGMGHGHFDKMGLLVYDNGAEVLSDYGAARFLNVVEKNGGHYLRENKSWAKQTIAHNALVVDETSHFNGKLKIAEQHSPDILMFEEGEGIAITRARMTEAYEGVSFDRTVAQVTHDSLKHPLVIDLLQSKSNATHQYDLPVHYNGQFTQSTFPYESKASKLQPLGTDNGYQHLWNTATATLSSYFNQVTWLSGDRFYTYSFLAPQNTKFEFTRLGASDPDFNLRDETSFVLRQPERKNATFVSVLEPHGDYNPSKEYTIDSASNVKALKLEKVPGGNVIIISFQDGDDLLLLLAEDPSVKINRKTVVGDLEIEWQGPYHLVHRASN